MTEEHTARLNEVGPIPTLEQKDFIDYLGGISGANIHEKTDMGAHLSHDGTFPNYDSAAPVLAPGLHLQADILHGLQGPESNIEAVTFALQPLAEIGRTEVDSFHKTFMGTISLMSSSGTTEVIPVAVKPITLIEGRRDHSLQESAMLDFSRQLGLPAPEIVGLCINEDGITPTAYVITRRIPDLQSLDKLDWQKEAVNAPTHLKVAVDTMVAMHSELLFHRDLEFKNLSSLDQQGSFVIFDLEWANSLRNLTQGDEEIMIDVISRGIESDMNAVRKSMGKLVYPNLPEGPVTEADMLEYEMTHLYTPYSQAIAALNSSNASVLTTALDRVLTRRKAQLSASQPVNAH